MRLRRRRHSLRLPAIVEVGAALRRASVVNLSASGALLRRLGRIRAGTPVTVDFGLGRRAATVTRTGIFGGAGLRFDVALTDEEIAALRSRTG